MKGTDCAVAGARGQRDDERARHVCVFFRLVFVFLGDAPSSSQTAKTRARHLGVQALGPDDSDWLTHLPLVEPLRRREMAGMLFDGKNEAAMSQATTIEGGKQSCEVVDVSDLVFKPDCFCLNQSSDEPFENVLKPDASLLKSDADEQLLMHFAFKEPVRLNGLEITAPASDEAPKTLKLYCNRLNMGFDDCDGKAAATAARARAGGEAGWSGARILISLFSLSQFARRGRSDDRGD